MKRDMELIRKILFKIEEEYLPEIGMLNSFEVEGYRLEVVAEHCDLLHQKYLIARYERIDTLAGLSGFIVGNLTDLGYDYLELIRNEEVWNNTNEKLDEKKIPKTVENIAKVAGTFVGAAINQIFDK